MDKFSGIHLFTDIDGTLATVNDEIPAKNIEAIEYFTQNGGTFSVATGRYLGDISVLDEITINGLSILNNGACIYDFINKKVISTKILPEKSVKPLIDFCVKKENLGLLIVNEDGYIIPIFDKIQRPIFHSRYEIREISDIKLPYYKILIVDNQNIFNTINELNNCKIDGIDVVQSGHNSIEIVPANIDKGSAFLEICKKNNIKKENTFFVGDSFNDISIMKNVGFSASMVEAHELVKKETDIILCKFEEGSTYNMIKIIEERVCKV